MVFGGKQESKAVCDAIDTSPGGVNLVNPKDPRPVRQQILEEGVNLTLGDRNKAYGDPYPDFTTFSRLVDAYLRGLGWEGPTLDAADGAVIMNQIKVSRISVNKNHRDNYVDGSVYMAIAGECADIDSY